MLEEEKQVHLKKHPHIPLNPSLVETFNDIYGLSNTKAIIHEMLYIILLSDCYCLSRIKLPAKITLGHLKSSCQC